MPKFPLNNFFLYMATVLVLPGMYITMSLGITSS